MSCFEFQDGPSSVWLLIQKFNYLYHLIHFKVIGSLHQIIINLISSRARMFRHQFLSGSGVG